MSALTVKKKKRWDDFLLALRHYQELNVVGPMAMERNDWPVPAIFVDSANRYQQGDPLHVSVGDGDSAWGPLDVELPPDKDFSDLAFALSQIPHHIQRVAMVGFLGGRRDHELLNFGAIHHFLKTRKSPVEVDMDWSVIGLSAGAWPLLLQGLFSLVVFEPARIQMAGKCKYTLSKPTLIQPVSSHGLSNEGFGEVRLESDGPFFIFKNPLT